MKFLNSVDLAKNELQNARVQNLASAPSSPVAGQIYYDTGTNHLYAYNGSGWEQASGASGSGTVTTVSVTSANGFAGSVANATSTPAVTISTSITGVLKGNGTAISAATAGTDFVAPGGALGTPSSGTLTACTGLPVSTGVSGLGTGVATALAAAADGTGGFTTKAYVDTLTQGLSPKPSAIVATAAALPACTYANGTSGVGATLTGNSNGQLTVDSRALVTGDNGRRVLVKNQASGLQNGLYTITQPGDAGTPFILTRDTSMDTTAEFARSFIVVEDEGATNANSMWVCTNTADPTVGTTAITFSQLNGATQLTAGTGIGLSGNTVSVASAYAGNGIGTVNGLAKGNGSGTITAAALSDLRTLGATSKYSATVGDGSSTSISVTQGTHGLASNGQILAQVFDASTGAMVGCDITVNNTNGTVTFAFATAPASNAYRIVLIG